MLDANSNVCFADDMKLKLPIHEPEAGPVPAGVDTALPRQVAAALGTTEAGLAQMRYRGTGPRYIKVGGRRVMYRWSDVRAYLDANTMVRTDDPRGLVSG